MKPYAVHTDHANRIATLCIERPLTEQELWTFGLLCRAASLALRETRIRSQQVVEARELSTGREAPLPQTQAGGLFEEEGGEN